MTDSESTPNPFVHSQPDGVVVAWLADDERALYVHPAHTKACGIPVPPPVAEEWPTPDPRTLKSSQLIDVFMPGGRLSVSIPTFWRHGIAPVLGLPDAGVAKIRTWRTNGRLDRFEVTPIPRKKGPDRRYK